MPALTEIWKRGVDLRHFLVVLAGIGAIAAVAVPIWFGRAPVTLDNAAMLLARDLRGAQNLAVVSAAPLTIRFDADGYRVETVDGTPAVNARTGDEFTRRWSRDAVFRGVRLVEVALDGGSQAIEFDRYGYAHPGGRLVLEFRGARRSVVVEAPRGLVAIEGLRSLEDDDGR
jgi:Tfp pilus assembly protein FimT